MVSTNSFHASGEIILPVTETICTPPETDKKYYNKHPHGVSHVNYDSPDDPIIQGKWGARHSMVFLGTLGVILLVMIRNVLSIAIVAMVDTTDAANNSQNSNLSDVCPIPVTTEDSSGQVNNTQLEQRGGDFYWDERTQGLILGAYFYGNVFSSLIGGRVAEYVGGKPMFGMGIFLSALFTLASPFSAQMSWQSFFIVRLLTGFTQGFSMPAITRCLVTWIPPMERSKFNTIVFSGAEIGTVISLALGGWLCDLESYGGWSLTFYIFGSLGVIWSILWFLLVSEKPESHPKISQEEKEYILRYCKIKRGKPISVPWLAVLTSVPIWAVFIMHIGHNWGYFTLLTLLPSYLSHIQHFDIKSNGFLSALPYLTKWGFALLYAFVMNKLTASERLSALSVRRISMLLGSFSPALGLVILTLTGCDQRASVAILVISTTLSGAVFCGFFCSHQDLCPNIAGTLYGFSNFLANSTGFLAPATAGAILLHNQTLSAWSKVFYISAGVYGITSTIYAIFITTEVQPFNNPKAADKQPKDEEEKLNTNEKEQLKKNQSQC